MRIVETKVYQFSELSDCAKENAIIRLSDINVDFDWWECTYDDAESVGLKITSFDLGRHDIKGRFLEDGYNTAKRIVAYHGPACETFKDAESFLEAYANLPEDEDGEKDGDARIDLENDFLNTILEDYRIILSHEYDYLTSAEAILETIEANEYEFTEDGRLA